jgi:hypothetical protein
MFGIRRQIKNDGESISLIKLIGQIKQCSSQLTYKFFLQQHPPNSEVNWQKSTFSQFSDSGKLTLETTPSESKIQNDIEELKTLSSNIENFADQCLAHLDKRGFEGKITGQELDDAIKKIDEVTCKYLSLITGEGYPTLKPEITLEWTNIFQVPFQPNT